MNDDKLTIVVNGVELEARPGQMLMEVTDAAEIYIPRFCYHDKLSIAANCRMCLVEVENAPKPLPACATPVVEGMQVFTKSRLAISAQKATMEFLLINHPLDCPICDQGGECELQDLAMGYGRDVSRFTERKRSVKDQDLGPLVSTDMTRCIHCTRCVRFGQEIAGIQELGTMGRGEFMEISTYVERSVDHELSGNIIDLCPVGALNNKPYRFSARAWEMEQRATVAPHDCLGSNLYAHVLRGRVKRVVPRRNEAINETWISDRDRFSYEGIYSHDRLEQPMLREDGEWRVASWDEALERAALGLREATSPDPHAGLGAWISPSSTVEEAYLTAKILRHLGSDNLDHRLRRRDFRTQEDDPVYPSLGMEVAEVENLNAALVIGSNLRREVPLLAHRIRKAAIAGGAVSFLNQELCEYLFPVREQVVTASASLADELARVIIAAGGEIPPQLASLLPAGLAAGESHRRIAADLQQGASSLVLLGQIAQRHPDYGLIRALAARLATLTNASFGSLTDGANAAGASLAGALPHRGPAGALLEQPGHTVAEMIASPPRALVLLGVEPEADCADGDAAVTALKSAGFVLAITPYFSGSVQAEADVVLPAGTFAETSGTFVNVAGQWQSFAGVAAPIGEARPAWKILRVLSNLLDVPDCQFLSSEDVRDELLASLDETPVAESRLAEGAGLAKNQPAPVSADRLDVPMYQVDPLVRRAESLQLTREALGPMDYDGDRRESA